MVNELRKQPPIPEHVLGIPTEPLLELDESLDYIALATGKPIIPFRFSHRVEAGLRTFPLIEKIQKGENIQPNDVRPYLGPIKNLVGGRLKTADRIAYLMGDLGGGSSLMSRLDRRIETEFPARIPEAIAQAGSHLDNVRPYIDLLSKFENPQSQYVYEITLVTKAIHETAQARARDQRRQVSSIDAGFAIRQELGRIIVNDRYTRGNFPMISGLLDHHPIEVTQLPKEKVLGIAAPEIIRMLYQAIPEAERDRDFLDSLDRNPHPFRRVASVFKSHELGWLDKGVNTLSSLRDLLPASGRQVMEIFDKLKDFTGPEHK